MARAYSLDLRERVIEAIRRGMSTREAARRSHEAEPDCNSKIQLAALCYQGRLAGG